MTHTAASVLVISALPVERSRARKPLGGYVAKPLRARTRPTARARAKTPARQPSLSVARPRTALKSRLDAPYCRDGAAKALAGCS